MKKFLMTNLVVLLIISLLIAGCSSQESNNSTSSNNQEKSEAQETIRIGTMSVGSVFHAIALGTSELINEHIGLNSSVESVGGDVAVINFMNEGKVEMGVGAALSYEDSSLGNAPFKEKGNAQLLAVGTPSYRPIVVRKGSGVKSFEDLKGKNFIGIRPALGEFEMITKALLKAYTMDEKDINIISTTETNETVEALKTGSVDAAIFPAAPGNPFVTELYRDGVIEFLDIPEDKLDKVFKELPKAVYKDEISKNSYPNQERSINTFTLDTYMTIRNDISEEMAYDISKTFYEQHEQFSTYHSSAKDWTLEKTISGNVVIPFHPGVIKYLEEKGKWTPELQKTQDELINKK